VEIPGIGLMQRETWRKLFFLPWLINKHPANVRLGGKNKEDSFRWYGIQSMVRLSLVIKLKIHSYHVPYPSPLTSIHSSEREDSSLSQEMMSSASESKHSVVEKSSHGHNDLARQVTLQLNADQYERLFFQPSAAKGDLAKRLGTFPLPISLSPPRN
jgi:hypothetical protein